MHCENVLILKLINQNQTKQVKKLKASKHIQTWQFIVYTNKQL